jgi:hypothetical protein
MATAAGARIILGLPTGAPAGSVVTLAATFARWTGASMETLLLLDSALDTLGALPFAREFQPLTMQWRTLDVGRLDAERRLIESRLRRQAELMSADSGLECLVQTVSGTLVAELLKTAAAADIIAVPAPGRAGEELFDPYPEILATIAAGPSPVLILPRTSAWRAGPVLLLRADDDRLASALARRIAAVAGADLVEIADDAQIAAVLRPGGKLGRHAASSGADRHARLIVISRPLLQGVPMRRLLDIVARDKIPVLVAG